MTAFPWQTATRPELTKDPVTGLWPGQATPEDLPDFLRRTVPVGTVYYDVVGGKLAKVELCEDPGCPNYGTPHVCVNPLDSPPASSRVASPPWAAKS